MRWRKCSDIQTDEKEENTGMLGVNMDAHLYTK